MPRATRPSGTNQAEADRIARAHPELKSRTKGRNRTVLLQPNTADRGTPAGADQVVVGLYDYEQDRSVIALVDAKAKKVLAVEDARASFQLSEEEREEAEALAAEAVPVVPPGAGGSP